jgi:hypothetical protein
VLVQAKGDREHASSMLVRALIELWAEAEPDEAARALLNLSELARRAAEAKIKLKQIRALKADLVSATTDPERERIARRIRELAPIRPSAEARRLNALAQHAQIQALFEQRLTPQTHVERVQIDARIAELRHEIAKYEVSETIRSARRPHSAQAAQSEAPEHSDSVGCHTDSE